MLIDIPGMAPSCPSSLADAYADTQVDADVAMQLQEEAQTSASRLQNRLPYSLSDAYAETQVEQDFSVPRGENDARLVGLCGLVKGSASFKASCRCLLCFKKVVVGLLSALISSPNRACTDGVLTVLP